MSNSIFKKLRWSVHFTASFFRAKFSSDLKSKDYFKWISEAAEKRRYQFSHLNEKSIVFDIGGFHGEFAEKIHKLYDSEVYIFEPVPEHFRICVQKFKNISKIKCFPFGLADKSEVIKISNNLNASSMNIRDGDQVLDVQIRSVNDFIKENGIATIDLMKINTEGAEYSLLRSLIDSGFISSIKHLQIQFHDFTEEMRRQKPQIVAELMKTHACEYSYEFVWDGWRLR